MFIKSIANLFEKNSVSICGLKGSGKDMLTANVIARRKNKYYISNLDYKIPDKSFIPYDFNLLRINNTYDNFINGNINSYVYPYPQDVDLYLSDCGIYFPSQYCNELNKKYKDLPTFIALSRQLGNCYVHTNSQALGRVWDKIREQSDTYIRCLWCKVFGKLVIQKIRVYDRYSSAEDNVPSFPMKRPILNSNGIDLYNVEKSRYDIQYGKVETRFLIYFNKSNYDTRYFKSILEGCSNER